MVSIIGFTRLEDSNGLPIDRPNDTLGSPVERVSVESRLRLLNVHGGPPIIPPGNALPKVVCLYLTLGVCISEVIA